MKYVEFIPAFAVNLDGGTTASDILIPIVVAIIGAIVTVIASLTLPPLLEKISSTLKASRHKPVGSPKASTLKILQVGREPLNEKDWIKVKHSYLIYIYGLYISSFISFLLIPTILIADYTIESTLSFFTISYSFLFFIFFLGFYARGLYLLVRYKNIGKDPILSRYFLFETAWIKIEGDFDEIIDLVQTTLKNMGVSSIEFDLKNKKFEAFIGSKLRYKTISMTIQNEQDKIHFMCLSSLLASSKGNTRARYEIKSLIINQFIKLALLYLNVDERSPSDQKGS
jgi:hypothetical protein